MFNFAKYFFNNTKSTGLAPIAVAATTIINDNQTATNANIDKTPISFDELKLILGNVQTNFPNQKLQVYQDLIKSSTQKLIEEKAKLIAEEKQQKFINQFLESPESHVIPDLSKNQQNNMPSIHRFLNIDELMDIKKNLCPETILFTHIYSSILIQNINKIYEVIIKKNFGFDEITDSKEKIKIWKNAYKSVFTKLQSQGYLINEYIENSKYHKEEAWKISWNKKSIIDMI